MNKYTCKILMKHGYGLFVEKNFTMKYSYELTYRKSYLVSYNDFV